ncbi:Phosphoenolpyruvate carboxylase 1 [Sarracenia purpurea var. burkii]
MRVLMSMWCCSDELRVQADELHKSSERDSKHYIEFWKQIPSSEPYRVILGDVRDKLYETRERSRHLLAHGISDIPEEATFTNEQVSPFLLISLRYSYHPKSPPELISSSPMQFNLLFVWVGGFNSR